MERAGGRLREHGHVRFEPVDAEDRAARRRHVLGEAAVAVAAEALQVATEQRAPAAALVAMAAADVRVDRDPVSRLQVLDPRATWSDAKAYDAQAAKLAGMYRENFERYADQVGDEVKGVAPRG